MRAMIAVRIAMRPQQLTLEPKSEHRFAPAGGRPTSVGFPYFNVEWPGEGLIVVIGWPGQWAAQFTRDDGQRPARARRAGADAVQAAPGRGGAHAADRAAVLAGRPCAGAKRLAAVDAGAQPAAHPRRQAAAAHLRLVQRRLLPGPPGPAKRANASSSRASRKAGVKLDYWWIDAGWYACPDWPHTGTWDAGPDALPARLPAHQRPARTRKGMGLIVWFEPERVTPGTFLYTNNPAWLLGPRRRAEAAESRQPGGAPWLTDHVDGMLTARGH